MFRITETVKATTCRSVPARSAHVRAAYFPGLAAFHGRMHQNTTEGTDRLALPAADAARLLGISRAHLLKLHSTGQLPAPVRLGRSVRWNRAELVAWLAAGAPPRVRWVQLWKGAGQ